MNVSHHIGQLLAITVLTAVPVATLAQSPSPRIRGPIELTPSVRLPGSLNPHIRAAEDLGSIPPDTVIPGITLVFSRSPQQQAALDQLLADQTNPASPIFHHWLKPDEFAARFGPAASDVAATEEWLQERGFTLDPSPPISGRITFSGTAFQVHQAFGAELHRFRSGDEFHFAPAAELSLPPALAPVTADVLHLSDFRPKPNVRPRPNYTTLSTQSHFLSPDDVLEMYDYWPLNGYSYGAYQSLAIVGQSFVPTGPESQVLRFLTLTSTGASITPVLVPGSGVEAIFPGDEGESEIDMEYSASVTPGANLYFVFTGTNPNYDVNDATAFAITHDIAPVISISYSQCEPLVSSAQLQQFNALFQQAAAQGQTIIAASGDQGPTACAVYDSSSGLTTAQQQGLAVNFPASSPFVTSVGGTQMAPGTFTAGSSPYWGSATASDVKGSLNGYTSEVVWNEDSTTGIFSSTGGSSALFPRPSWQTGVPGIPSGSSRLVPDIAFQASAGNPGYVICTDDPALGGDPSDCAGTDLHNSSGKYILSGGTSFSAPIFAGFVTFLNGYEQSNGQGNVNPVLYSLAAQPSIYASAFHDITVGSTACLSAQTNCSAPAQSGFDATVGYDQATGLGSLDFAKLIAAWPISPSRSLIHTVLFAGSSARSANPGDPVALPIQLNESSLTGAPGPIGTVSLMLDGGAPISIPLSTSGGSATANYVFNAPSTMGSHIASLLYPGDSTHSGSAVTIVVMVGSPVATGGVTLSASNLSLAANGTGSTQVAITPSGGYNGALTWSASYTGGTGTQTICYLVASPPVISGTIAATMHMGVGTACNSPLHANAAQASDVQLTALDQPSLHTPRQWLQHAAQTPATPILALLLFGLLPHRRRKRLSALTALLVATLPMALSGCGGASGSGGGGVSGAGSTPQPQVYTITITAKDSVQTSITASTTFTLTVN